MNRVVVLNVVGLTDSLLGEHTPHIWKFAQRGQKARIAPTFPAVTCTAQATYLTGQTPARHGIVGNGWYDRTLAEVQFWKQSNHVVMARKLWKDLRETVGETFTCAQLFWWYNMYAAVDYSLTPRPIYRADGGKIFDIYGAPSTICPEVKSALGDFPFPSFWGPLAGIASSRWIADSAKWVEERYNPGLSLVYLPHLDYNLQRLGPSNPGAATDLQQIDEVVGGLISFYEAHEIEVVLLSEYGITDVDRPIYLNRLFRAQGWLAVRDELGTEVLDAGASKVFAVADHQVAHVYVNDPSLLSAARTLLERHTGIDRVFGRPEQAALGIDHARGGDLLAVADARSWFAYYYWMDDARAPDFARTIDIHRKPGYDPAELFIDPKLIWPKLRIARFLLRKKLGFRALLDVIPLDATLVRGSHGRVPENEEDWPLLISGRQDTSLPPHLSATDVYGWLRSRCLDAGSKT